MKSRLIHGHTARLSLAVLVAVAAIASSCSDESSADAELLQQIADLQAQIDATTTSTPPSTTWGTTTWATTTWATTTTRPPATTTTRPPATTRAIPPRIATIPAPSHLQASTQESDTGQTLEVYLTLTDYKQKPIATTPEAELTLRILDPVGTELYQGEFTLGQSDLRTWTTRFGAVSQAGFIIRIPHSDIDRSLTGSAGVVSIFLDYGNSFFDFEVETNDLQEASEAMKSAAAMEGYLETSVDLSQISVQARQWRETPLRAGCYTEYGSYGRTTDGIRIDFEVENLDDSISTWFRDVLLRTPDGFTIEPDYSSSLMGLEAIPNLPEKGYLFFEDLDCLLGEYRLVMSTYIDVYLDETFWLGAPPTASGSTTTTTAPPTSSPALDTTTSTQPTSTTTSQAPSTTTTTTSTTTTTTEPVDQTGTREQPIPIGDGYDLGGGWMLAVTKVKKDAAAAIAAANVFNDSPLPGRRFVLVDLDVSYSGNADPKTISFDLSIDAVGTSGYAYDSYGCGVEPDSIDRYRDIFAGGIESGQVCFDVTEVDADSLVLYASSTGGNTFFSLDDSSASPSGVSSHLGPLPGADSTDSRLNPTPIGYAADIGGGMSLRVNGVISDQTSAVLSENQFNDPPPAGYVFAIVNVTFTVTDVFTYSIAGAEYSIVGDSNVGFDRFGCGAIPDELDRYVDFFLGGSVTGNVCFVLPVGELAGGLALYAAGEWGESNHWFAVS